ncbi:MAG TPA: carbamoyltransferase C-terminal domain-containing protein [Opitutaceae bacterium]|jgi:carbamoyltransferase
MTVLGLAGGLDAAHENAYDLPFDFIHDAAAVLVQGGRVAAGAEEERLNRIKHTNKAPRRSLKFCLEQAGIGPGSLDAAAYYATEPYCARILQNLALTRPAVKDVPSPREMIRRMFAAEVGWAPDASRIHFVDHHWAHAVSAYALSGFDAALVATLDGTGEGTSGCIYDGRGRELKLLRRIPDAHSLGYLYRDVIKFLGYEMFDEYKVMGMAPYGDPARYRALFATFYELLPDGEYRLHLDRVFALFRVTRPRRRGEEFTVEHRDIAAALQSATEEIGLHVLRHFRGATGHRRVCLAGGVAHNCSLNGRVAYSGLFERIFVQPAAHDAGCALGAALAIQLKLDPATPTAPLADVFWGREAGGDEEVGAELRRWSGFLAAERPADVVAHAADLLAARRVIGWVQGRSEFGPRALGNRSILADPRPAENKGIINAMVKKREAYRPFAPSVTEEAAGTYFVLPADQPDFPYMSVVLQVKPEWRERLGAITHVDGTARVQTVRRESHPRYWALLHAFGERTGVPMLLNTSFNNHAEPIVDTARDAIVCFLTTGLDALVIGDWAAVKVEPAVSQWLALRPSLPEMAALRSERRCVEPGRWECVNEIRFTYSHGRSQTLSAELFRVLSVADGVRSLGELAASEGLAADRAAALIPELRELWGNRLIVLTPP